MKSLKIAILLVLIFLFVSNANAALVKNGNYFTDTSSNLDWLKWDLTSNLSYNYVSTQFALGGQFQGYRFATANEAETLLSLFGFEPLNYTNTWVSAPVSAWNALADYMGYDVYGGGQLVYGMVASIGTSAVTYANFRDPSYPYLSCGFQACTALWNYDKNRTYSFLGSFLVRESESQIPIPAPLTLIVLGLTAINYVRRRK